MSPIEEPFREYVAAPLLWSLKNGPEDLSEDVLLAARETITPEGDCEYTVYLPNLPPEQRMTHWMTVDDGSVVELRDWR